METNDESNNDFALTIIGAIIGTILAFVVSQILFY